MTQSVFDSPKSLAILSIVAISSILFFSSVASQQATGDSVEVPLPEECTGEKVSVTVPLGQNIKPGEVLVLLDTTGSGELCVVHVAANLPCDKGPTNGPRNDAPEVSVVAGVAGGPLAGVIESSADDAGFAGPNNTCVFHDTLFASEAGHDITDVILGNFGERPSNLNGAVITITGTYDEGIGDEPIPS